VLILQNPNLFDFQIFGSLVIKCPGCQLARNALAELDKIANLLERAKTGTRPSTLLVSGYPAFRDIYLPGNF